MSVYADFSFKCDKAVQVHKHSTVRTSHHSLGHDDDIMITQMTPVTKAGVLSVFTPPGLSSVTDLSHHAFFAVSFDKTVQVRDFARLSGGAIASNRPLSSHHGCLVHFTQKSAQFNSGHSSSQASVPLSSSFSTKHKAKTRANSSTVTHKKSVPVPCRYYPIPMEANPISRPSVCDMPPAASALPLTLAERGSFLSSALPLAMGCWNDTPVRTMPSLRAYVMFHSIRATLGGLVIDPLSFDIKTDIASFCWQGRIETTKHDYEKAKKTLDAPLGEEPLITVDIDGLLFVFLAEEVSHHRTFNKTSVSILGRSVTAKLSESYAGHKAVSSADLYASQIVSEQLENLPIRAEFLLEDWRIPNGSYTGNGKTPIAICDDIARASGGFLMSHPSEPILTLAPRYKAAAWQLATTQPDRVIGLDAMLSLSITTHQAVRYNTVTLVGDKKGGVVYREREGRDKDAPTIDSPLYTDKAVFLAAGIAVLSDSGTHSTIGVTLPLSKTHGLELAMLGEIWQINDTADNGGAYLARVTSVSVQASVQDDVVMVRQTVELDRYDDI